MRRHKIGGLLQLPMGRTRTPSVMAACTVLGEDRGDRRSEVVIKHDWFIPHQLWCSHRCGLFRRGLYRRSIIGAGIVLTIRRDASRCWQRFNGGSRKLGHVVCGVWRLVC
jgi:hypothetical protein